EMPGPAIVKIIAIDGRDHRMGKSQLLNCSGDAGGLGRIERAGKPRLDVAEGAGPRARIAHDHEGRVLFLPALANVRTARFLADGDEPVLLDNGPRRRPLRRARRLDPDPGGFSRHRLVGPMRLLRVTGCRGLAMIAFKRIGTRSHASLSPTGHTACV